MTKHPPKAQAEVSSQRSYRGFTRCCSVALAEQHQIISLSRERKHWQQSLEKMLNAAFCWLKRDLELSPAASFLGCERKQGFVCTLKANRIVSEISDSTTNYFSRLEWPMRVRFLASSSRHTENIMKYSYLMEVGVTHWMLHWNTPAKKVTKIIIINFHWSWSWAVYEFK